MKALRGFIRLATLPVLLFAAQASAQQRAQFEILVAVHAKANNVPEALVHRVIVRESKYRPDLVGRGGTIGLMQIKLATARGLGYTGDAAGLHDPDTNLTFGVKYLAGAWRAAEGDHARAMRYFASGYYYVAKRQRLERPRQPETRLASAPPKESEPASDPAQTPEEAAPEPADTAAAPQEIAKPVPLPRKDPRKFAVDRAHVQPQVPRPPAAISGANAIKPR